VPCVQDEEKVKRLPAKHGEHYLASTAAIKITLENGTVATFNLRAELRIPDDPDEMIEEFTNAPERIAFWAYQAEQQLAKVRECERKLAEVEGKAFLTFRTYLEDEAGSTQNGGMRISDHHVRACLDIDDPVAAARKNLNSERRQYGVLRETSDALRNRLWVLKRLVSREREQTT